MQFIAFALIGSLLYCSKIVFSASFDSISNISQTDLDDRLVEAVGNVELMGTLIKSASNLNHVNPTAGFNALQMACRYGHTKSVDLLLKQEGIDINAADKLSRTPLILACTYGHAEIVDLLLEKEDLDVNHCSRALNEPALLNAVHGNYARIVESLLLKSKANVNAEDFFGKSALIIASRSGAIKIVPLLIAEKTINVNHSDYEGRTALIHACIYGLKEVVRALLFSGKCDVLHRDNYGNEALKYVKCCEIKEMIVEYLRANHHELESDHVSKIESEAEFIREFGYNFWRVESLVKGGVDVNTKDEHGRTALMLACEKSRSEFVDFLLSQDGIDINSQDYWGDTALMLGVKSVKVVESLLNKPEIKLFTTNKSGRNAFMLASMTGQLGTVRMLLEKGGFDVNATDPHGTTALILALAGGHLEIVELILSSDGIDPSTANKWLNITSRRYQI